MLVHSSERASRKSVSSTKRGSEVWNERWLKLDVYVVYGIDRFDSRTNILIHKGGKVQSIIGPCMFFCFFQ